MTWSLRDTLSVLFASGCLIILLVATQATAPATKAQQPSATLSPSVTASPTPTLSQTPTLSATVTATLVATAVADCFASCPGAVPDTGGRGSGAGGPGTLALAALFGGALALATSCVLVVRATRRL